MNVFVFIWFYFSRQEFFDLLSLPLLPLPHFQFAYLFCLFFILLMLDHSAHTFLFVPALCEISLSIWDLFLAQLRCFCDYKNINSRAFPLFCLSGRFWCPVYITPELWLGILNFCLASSDIFSLSDKSSSSDSYCPHKTISRSPFNWGMSCVSIGENFSVLPRIFTSEK